MHWATTRLIFRSLHSSNYFNPLSDKCRKQAIARFDPLDECYDEWLLKNSFTQNLQK